MQLAWTTVLYNEEKRIEKTINSLASVINTAVIGIDRKTSDKTKETVVNLMKHFQKKLDLFDFTFAENFSTARNQGIALAEKLGYDYVIIIDGDEYLDKGSIELIQKIMTDDPSRPDFDSVMSIQVGHHYNSTQQQSAPTIRIFKSQFRYIYRIHETPDISSDKNVPFPQIIIHNDNKEDRPEKITKYRIKNILLDIKDYPDKPELKFNLGMEYISIAQFEQGIKYLQEAIDNNLSESMQLMAHIRISRALHVLNRHDEQYEILKSMVTKFPYNNEHLIHLGAYHLMRNEAFEAANYIFVAANMIKPNTLEMKYDHYYTWVPWFLVYQFAQLINWKEGKEKVKKIFESNFPDQLHKLERTTNGKNRNLSGANP